MKTALSRIVVPTISVFAAGALLSGCFNSTALDPSVSPSLSAPANPTLQVDDADLGKALHTLVFQGAQIGNAEDGACLVVALKSADIPVAVQADVAEHGGDDWGAVVNEVSTVDPDSAAKLMSGSLRVAFDRCVDRVMPASSFQSVSYAPPQGKKTEPAKKEPKLTPKYEVRETEEITSATQLNDGLVSMFSSYALSNKQKAVYRDSGDCLAGVVNSAGFSQQSLRFLAGGAPIGAGSIVDYLPTSKDKKIWESSQFVTDLTDCANAKPRK